jgi:HPr kinase/phosphorylase
MPDATIHASAVLVGARAVLIRGPAGAGKSSLALRLIMAVDARLLPFARLVADDRAHLEACHGRLVVRPAQRLAGLLEIRGLGIRRLPYEPVAVVGLVVDLGVDEIDRLPQPDERQTALHGITLPRLGVAPGIDPLPRLLALAHTAEAA